MNARRYARARLAVLVGSALMVGSALADQITFQDWTVSSTTSGMYAATTNDSGEVLGEFCYYSSKTCEWEIGMHAACKKDLEGIVLANSESAATPLEVGCTGKLEDNPLYSYVFKSWQNLESAIHDSSRVGFAVPLASDQFTVVRFSLVGRSDAQQAMEKAFFAKAKNGTHGTADQVM